MSTGRGNGIVLRVARPTNNLGTITRMYMEGLGLELLGSFEHHDGFDGVMLGRPDDSYHLEFTLHRDHPASTPPDTEHLLIFYLPDPAEWTEACERMSHAGFTRVASANPFWDVVGQTFADVDGCRVVLQRAAWTQPSS